MRKIKIPKSVEIVEGPNGFRFRGTALEIRELSFSLRALCDKPVGYLCRVGSIELYVADNPNDPQAHGRVALPKNAWNILASKFIEVTAGWEETPFDFNDCGYLYPKSYPDLGIELIGEPLKE